MNFRAFALSTALILTPLAALAAPWNVDKSHAFITFTVDHFGFSDVPGMFRDFDAEIDFDPENIEATKATFTIDAASVDTFFAARDEHIRKPDFLNVEVYPQIVFTSTGVTKTGDDTADIAGELTLHGETRPVTFQAVLNKLDASPFDPSLPIAGFTITGEIDRTEFGIETYAPAIGAIIPVTIEFEMSPANGNNS